MDLSLPVVHIVAETLPEGWEKAVIETWDRGAVIKTMYDKPGDPPSRDVSLYLTVANPFAEPRIHRAMPGGLDDLEVYRQEVVEGIHDHWVVTDDPNTTKWQYSYHERFANYSVPGVESPANQLQYVIDALIKDPFTRRALAITWKPWLDEGLSHPPCLQYMWFRIFGDQLVVDCHIRSNDAYKAAFMNMYAFTDWQRMVAEEVSKGLGRTIYPGQYNHIADSFHIYGSYFEDFKGFLDTLETRTWEQRTYRTEDVQILIDEARQKIAATLERERQQKG